MRTKRLILLAALVSAPTVAAAQVPTDSLLARAAQSRTKGAADAPVTIIELSDFQCPFCAEFALRTLPALDSAYIATGKVRLVFFNFPLPNHGASWVAAEAAMCAGAQDAFWPMHDRLFASPGPFTREVIDGYGRELGLDMARFRSDLDARTFLDTIRRDYQAAAALGFSSTPMFFINGRPVRGAQPLSVFAEVVAEEIDRAEALVRTGVAPDAVYDHLVTGAQGPAGPGPDGDAWTAATIDPMAVYAVGLGLPGHQIGPDDALVTLVEFTDFECGFCARNRPAVERLIAAHGADLRVITRHLPLRFHPHAQLAAEAAVEAAEQGKLVTYAALLFGNQRALERADLERYAGAAGLDLPRFRAALDDRRHHDAVAADAAAANALGVTGTPTLFVNGQPVVGAVPYQQLEAIVSARMEHARMLLGAGIDRADVYTMITVAADQTEVGDRSRVPSATAAGGLVELEALDAHTAVLAACQARDRDRATSLYGKLKGALRAGARSDCRVYGVDLD